MIIQTDKLLTTFVPTSYIMCGLQFHVYNVDGLIRLEAYSEMVG